MSNATDIVKKGRVRWADEFMERGLEAHAAEKTYYPGIMIGVDETGYFAKFDDAQSMIFAGIASPDEGRVVAAIGSANDTKLEIQQPRRFELAIASVAVTDLGKTVYASDDQTGVLTPAALAYANVVGHVVDVVGTNIALVEAAYDGVGANARLGAARVLAATGAQTVTKYDMEKLIVCPNTAAYAVTLPEIANISLGQRLTFVKTTSDAKALTLTGGGSDKINGSSTEASMDAQYDTITIRATAAAVWQKTGQIIA